MVNPEHAAVLKQGVEVWNEWRRSNADTTPDLTAADLTGANLAGADLRGVILKQANLSRAVLTDADLGGASLHGANLQLAVLNGAKLTRAELGGADFHGAVLKRVDLREAILGEADLTDAVLTEADLTAANLERALLVRTDLSGCSLAGCRVYGTSAWDVKLEGADQSNLVISSTYSNHSLTVDNLEVAQFIYLLLHNQRIREVIDTVTSKVVLILGRFSEERKVVLDEIRAALRQRNLVPVLFDFEKPTSKDLTGTVETLARMARLIIADLTDPSSVPHELATIVPFLPNTPVMPIRLKGSEGYGLFDDLRERYKEWVLPVYEYDSRASIIGNLADNVIGPALQKSQELQRR